MDNLKWKIFICCGLSALIVSLFGILRNRSQQSGYMKNPGSKLIHRINQQIEQQHNGYEKQRYPYPHYPVVHDAIHQQLLTLYSARANSEVNSVMLVGYYRLSSRISSLQCSFELDSGDVVSAEKLKRNPLQLPYGMSYDAIQLECQAPSSVPVRRIVGVRFSASCNGMQGSVRLPVTPPPSPSSSPPSTMAACVPPLYLWPYGKDPKPMALQIVEFVETNRQLGISHFYFYKFAVPDTISRLLHHYQTEGLATVMEWGLGRLQPMQDIHYFGQLVAIYDCLELTRQRHKWAAFIDIDEFPVPIGADSLPQLANRLGACVLGFRQAIFPSLQPVNQSLLADAPASVRKCNLPGVTGTFRTEAAAFGSQSKVIVDPRRVEKLNVHSVSASRRGCTTRALNPHTEGLLHHVRNCVKPLEQGVRDYSLLPWLRKSAVAIAERLGKIREQLEIVLC